MYRGDNNNYYSISTAGNTMTGPRNRANCRSSRRPAYTRSLIARAHTSRSWKRKNSLGTASGSLSRTIHRATIKSKLVRPYGGKGWQKRRSIESRRCKKESVSPIETSPVRERKRQAPIANGTDGTNARVASLFLPANRVKSLRPPPPSPPAPPALPCTPALSLLLVFLLLFCLALQLCHALREKHEKKIRGGRRCEGKKKRRKKRASNKTEEAILSREHTRRERGERSKEGGRGGTVYREGKSGVPAAVVVDIMREE